MGWGWAAERVGIGTRDELYYLNQREDHMITFNRREIAKAVKNLASITEDSNAFPLRGYLLFCEQNGDFKITSNDLEKSLVATVSAKISGTDMCNRFLIPANKFLKICNFLKEDEVNIDVLIESIIVSAGKSKFTFSNLPTESFQTFQDFLGINKVQIESGLFCRMIKKCERFQSNADVRTQLMGECIEVKDGWFSVIASDGHRMSLQKTKIHSDLDVSVVVPREAVEMLKKILEKESVQVNLFFSNNFIKLELEKLEVYINLIDKKYVNYKIILRSSSKYKILIDKLKFIDVLKRSSFTAHSKNHGCTITTSPHGITITTKNEEKEKFEELIEGNYDFEFSVNLNLNYILDALGVIEEKKVEINCNSNDAPVIFTTQDLSETYVIMPMRE